MTKKLLSLLLALVLVFSLVACSTGGNETEAETPAEETQAEETQAEETQAEETQAEEAEGEQPYAGKTLKFAGLDGGYGTAGWDAVIAEFERITGATVEKTYSQQIENEVQTQFLSGSAPDVNFISLGREAALTEAQITEQQLLDITDAFSMTIPGEEATPNDKITEGTIGSSISNPYGDDRVFLAPIFVTPNGLFHNASLFTTGGGELELPTTVDEMVALSDAVEGASLYTYPTAGYHDSAMPAMMFQIGGQELFDRLMNYDSQAWANEATPLFEAMGKILAHVNPNTVAQANGEGFTNNQLQVMKNESLFMPNGTWIVNEMAEAQGVAEGFQWGLIPLPAYKEGADRYVFSFTEQVWASANTQEPELAKAFIAFLYSDFAAQAFIDNGGAVTPITNAVELISDPALKVFYEMFENPDVKIASGGFATAPAVEGVSVTDALYEAINSVASGDMTVEQWQQGVVDAVKAIEEAKAAQ